jgi:CBS domain containing-hemolysin-like protein
LAISNPVWVSTRIVARPMSYWVRFVAPLISVVRWLADRITMSIIGAERTRENILHIDELKILIEDGIESGEITKTERLLVEGLLNAGATEVRKIMTPRLEMAFLNGDLDPAEMRKRFFEMRRGRVPVYRGVRDHVEGFLYVEDVVNPNSDQDGTDDLHQLLRAPIAVPVTTQVDEMLDFFDQRDAKAALVVNEFGTIEGIVTLSDVTRMLFSGVFEHAVPELVGIDASEGGFDVEGRVTLVEIHRSTGLKLDDPLMATIAGLALRAFGRLPEVGESISLENCDLTVLEIDNLRITRLRVEPHAGSERTREVPQ